LPNIFIGGKHIGDDSHLKALNQDGALRDLLDEAGAFQHIKVSVKELRDPAWQKQGHGKTFKIGSEEFNITVC
jgi:hypothetical protein